MKGVSSLGNIEKMGLGLENSKRSKLAIAIASNVDTQRTYS